MKTFAQFIAEKFYDSADTRSGYCEILVNPNADEMRQWGKRPVDNWDDHPEWGPHHYLGALVDDKRVFIFNRDDHAHADALVAYKQKNPKYDPHVLTLYFYYYPLVKTLAVSTSGFSSPLPPPPINQVMSRLKAMPWFKKFILTKY